MYHEQISRHFFYLAWKKPPRPVSVRLLRSEKTISQRWLYWWWFVFFTESCRHICRGFGWQDCSSNPSGLKKDWPMYYGEQTGNASLLDVDHRRFWLGCFLSYITCFKTMSSSSCAHEMSVCEKLSKQSKFTTMIEKE